MESNVTMCDVLVVGAGVAGCTAALRAADLGAEVLLVMKDNLGESNTKYAQGGIIGCNRIVRHHKVERTGFAAGKAQCISCHSGRSCRLNGE